TFGVELEHRLEHRVEALEAEALDPRVAAHDSPDVAPVRVDGHVADGAHRSPTRKLGPAVDHAIGVTQRLPVGDSHRDAQHGDRVNTGQRRHEPSKPSNARLTHGSAHSVTALGSSTGSPSKGVESKYSPVFEASQTSLRSHSIKTLSESRYYELTPS